MTALRLVLAFLGALAFSTAFVPHHRVALWSISRPVVSRTSGRLLVTRSTELHVLANRNTTTTVNDYTDDVSKDVYEQQQQQQVMTTELKEIEKLGQLVVQHDQDDDISSSIVMQHTEHDLDTSSAVETTQSKQLDNNVELEEVGGFLSVIWRARLLFLGAAALYGTNFSVVKILGDTIPVGISATLRFGLAALVTLPWLLAPPKDGSSFMPTTIVADSPKPKTWWEIPWKTLQTVTSTTTVGAALAGFEVGMWNAVAYLAQAVGLETTDASKVTCFLLLSLPFDQFFYQCSLTPACVCFVFVFVYIECIHLFLGCLYCTHFGCHGRQTAFATTNYGCSHGSGRCWIS